jgi:hypothetical protein
MTDNIAKAKSEYVKSHAHYNPNQHCTAEDCYTFSHTAQYCLADQNRFCTCAFDYEDGVAQSLNEEMKQSLIEKVLDDLRSI